MFVLKKQCSKVMWILQLANTYCLGFLLAHSQGVYVQLEKETQGFITHIIQTFPHTCS